MIGRLLSTDIKKKGGVMARTEKQSKKEWLVDELRREIVRKKVDTPIQGERHLAERFGVSRVTVRQALFQLQSEGLIYTLHGSGSYVAAQRVTKRMTLNSFTEEIKQRGMKPSSVLISVATVDNAPGEAPPEGPFTRIERVRMGDNEPMALEVTFVSQKLVPDLAKQDLTKSIYTILNEKYHLKITRAEEHLSPVILSKDQAKLLKFKPGEPALEIKRIALDMSGREIERSISIRPGERYDFKYIVTGSD